MRRPVHLGRILGWTAITVILLLALTAGLAAATDYLNGKVRTGDTVTVPANEKVDHDLYIFAGKVAMNGTVNGDLVVAGGTIDITGPVTGDVLVFGGQTHVSGAVGGDLRAGVGQLTITGNVAEDVLAGSGTLDVTAPVGGDLIFGVGTATVSGPVTGSIEGGAGTYSRSGTVGGTENVTLNRTQNNTIVETNPVLDAVRQFVVVLLFGALALWLLPRALASAETALERRTLASFGSGLLVLVGYVGLVLVIVLAMIALAFLFAVLTLGAMVGIELIGGIVAILVLTFGFVVGIAFIGDVVVGLAIGRMLLPAIGMRGGPSRWTMLGMLAVGAALVVIVCSLPVIGWIAKLAVAMFGLGAILVAAWFHWRGHPLAPVATSAPMAPPPPPVSA